MKEIWKKFSDKCKEAWNKTSSVLEVLLKEFVADSKALLLQLIDLIQDLIGNSIKAVEVILMGLVVAVFTALFEAIYDTIMYGFSKLKELFTPKAKD